MLEMLALKNLRRQAAGMDEILPEPGDADDAELLQIVMIPLDKIQVNPEQPRKFFSEAELEELTGSIREYGVLQPILVRRMDDGFYMIIAGERRFRASLLAGLVEIPAIVREMEDEQAALIALVENVQRENLNYIEEARAYRKLMDDFHLTQNDIALKVGKQQSTISNKIRILTLPADIQDMLAEHNLTERHARALLRVPGESDRKKLINRIVKNNLNVKQSEKLIEEFLLGVDEQRRKRNKINYISYKIYVNTIRKSFAQIKEMEEDAVFSQEDKGEFLELKILIPKKDRCFT